jgi:hypothetical protein
MRPSRAVKENARPARGIIGSGKLNWRRTAGTSAFISAGRKHRAFRASPAAPPGSSTSANRAWSFMVCAAVTMGRFCSPAFMGLACAEDDGGPFRFPPLGLLPSTTGRDGWCFPGRFLPIRDRRGADCRFWRSRDGRCPAASFLPLLLVKLAEGERHASVLGTGKVHHLGRRPRARWALARDWGRRGRRGRFSGVVGDGEQLGCGAPAHSGRHPSPGPDV